MSRMISSDQRSPSISTEAFSGHPERRFGPAFFRTMFASIVQYLLALHNCSIFTCKSQVKCEYCSQVGMTAFKSRIILKFTPKGKVKDPFHCVDAGCSNIHTRRYDE